LSSETLNAGNAPTYYAAGYALTALVYGFDHIGSFFNPAVTLGAYLQGNISVLMGLSLALSQTVGGVLGGVIGNLFRETPIPSYNPTDYGKAFAVEAIYTGGLVLVMQAVGMYKNAQEPNSYFGFALGSIVTAGVASVSVISGGAFNPAVGMAIDFATLSTDKTTFNDIWLYWLAPCTGAIVASIFSRAMHAFEHDKWAVPGWFCRCRSRCCGYEEEEEEGGGDGAEMSDGRMPFIVPCGEFVGTFFVVLTSSLQSSDLVGPTKAISVGMALSAMVYSLDHVCGADFNPAVTVGVALRMGRLFKDSAQILTVIAAQFGGAFSAAVVAFLLQGKAEFPAPNGNTGAPGAVFFEAIWTAFLTYTVCAVMTDITDKSQPTSRGRYGHSRSHHGLAIGFCVTAGILCSVKSGAGSGGCFNPALCVHSRVSPPLPLPYVHSPTHPFIPYVPTYKFFLGVSQH